MTKTKWRKRRDSNPRCTPFRYASFQDWSHQPLGHSSLLEVSNTATAGAQRIHGESIVQHRELLPDDPGLSSLLGAGNLSDMSRTLCDLIKWHVREYDVLLVLLF